MPVYLKNRFHRLNRRFIVRVNFRDLLFGHALGPPGQAQAQARALGLPWLPPVLYALLVSPRRGPFPATVFVFLVDPDVLRKIVW